MSLYDILNILILALSLSTVILTMMAYIHHQVRRINKSDQSQSHSDLQKIESVFFKRFAPHIEAKHAARNLEVAQRKLTNKIKFSTPGFVAAMVLTAIGLVLSFVFIQRANYGSKTKELVSKGETVERLVEQGLLRKYSFEPVDKMEDPLQSAKFEMNTSDPVDDFLKDQKIVFVPPRKESEAKVWLDFLQSVGIKVFKTASSSLASTSLSEDQLVIAPRLLMDSEKEAEIVQAALNDRTRFLFYESGDTEVSPGPSVTSFEKQFGLNLQQIEQRSVFLKFAKDTLIDFPPGKRIKFAAKPAVRTIAYPDSKAWPLAYATGFDGSPLRTKDDNWGTLMVGALSGETPLFWTALLPTEANFTENSEAYRALKHLISVFAGLPIVQTDLWPNHKSSAAVVSVDVEDEFENIDNLLESFDRHNTKGTLFVVSDLYENYEGRTNPLFKDHEIASHGDSHDSFKDQEGMLQFRRLQESRHAIESLSEKRVRGFRPPYEDFDELTLYTASLNKIDYFFGDQSKQGLVPYWLDNGLLFIPRHNRDDYSLFSDRTLVSPKRILAEMLRDVEGSKKLNGGYFLNLHSQIFGQAAYIGVVDKLLEALNKDTDLELMTFSELVDWWTKREQIKIRIDRNSAQAPQLIVKNEGEQEFTGGFKLYSPRQTTSKLRGPASSSRISCAERNNFGLVHCFITALPAGEVIELPLSTDSN